MGTEVVKYDLPQLERMANAIAKSNMFAVKTPEAALSLLLIAQSEGVHPAQAMLEYDVIEGKPALKSAAMLARFQASGGKVRWLEATDEKVSGEFSHPSGGTIVVSWDTARITKAGLSGRNTHQKYPTQMKRARCISEAVRALFPASIPVGLYSVEETQDMVAEEKDVTPVSQAVAIAQATNPNALTESEILDHLAAIEGAADPESTKAAFTAAYRHATDAKDGNAVVKFQTAYNQRKAQAAA